MSVDFFVTSLIVVLIPGTGVIYTLSFGVFRGALASTFAAFGCTLGILPHIAASVLGLAAILHASAIAFQVVKFAGVAYLFYLAWGIWRDNGKLAITEPEDRNGHGKGLGNDYLKIVIRGFLINILNPKLSVFFLAFLPQFVPAENANPLPLMIGLGAIFMLMTFVIFVGYGFGASYVRSYVLSSPRVMNWVRRSFAAAFAAFGLKLALTN